ncbi:MAG: 4Fe-4S dicluster domain-containing protein [bacterium]|nr:4Fe-4S dicluster domain-containing protein [bacterium]
MGDSDNLNLNIDERLATLRFICDNKSHITVDVSKCKNCENKNCVYFCPAGVYNREDGSGIPVVDYENCLECGTCRICCPYNAIEWNYPCNASGVRYRFG